MRVQKESKWRLEPSLKGQMEPRGAQERPSWLQEAPKRLQVGTKMAKSAQVEPKSSPRASKLGGKGFQRALGEQHGGIRRAFEGQNMKTSNFDDPTTLLKGFLCIRRALGKPKWSPSGAWSQLVGLLDSRFGSSEAKLELRRPSWSPNRLGQCSQCRK